MTIRELYQWAKTEDALDLEIKIYNNYGDISPLTDPFVATGSIFENGGEYEVELIQ